MKGKLLNNRYLIEEKVGSGGMADVYKGMDTETGETVAIKVLKQEYSSDPQYLRRLGREAEAMVSLKNEHIVSFYDIGSEDDIHYLVIEYVDGRTLREVMDEKGAMDPDEAAAIVCDVLEGLSHAHKKGLVHRDVKPQNIMITSEGVIKLADFGIAKIAGKATKTYDGKEAMGSVYYISPEQAMGDTVDAQADIYSVGIMLYEMLSGAPPFTGDNAVQVALKHINEQMIPLTEAVPDIAPALSDVVSKAACKSRKYRYASADEMERDLKKAVRNPLSRFASLPEEALRAKPEDPGRGGKTRGEHATKVIIASVLSVVALFIAMFVMSLAGQKHAYAKAPSFLGYALETAEIYAENRGFSIEVTDHASSDEYPAGEVCGQSPAAGSKVKPGTVFKITVSTGMETVQVPDLYGLTVEEARKRLEAAGLELDTTISYEVSANPVGTVIGQSVNPHETVMAGDSISITVSKEVISETTTMPNLIGREIAEALDMLKNAGIGNYWIYVSDTVDNGYEYDDYQVFDQSPAAGMAVLYNSSLKVDIKMFKEDIGKYKAEFSENVTLSSSSNEVVVTILTGLGEVVIYRGIYEPGSYSIPFTGRYWQKGNYTCTLYVNGSVYTSFTRSFE